MLPGIEDNDCIDGSGQVTPSSRSLCQIRETCATRFRRKLCQNHNCIDVWGQSHHHPDHFIKLE